MREGLKLAMNKGIVYRAAGRLSLSMKALAKWVRAAKAGKLQSVRQPRYVSCATARRKRREPRNRSLASLRAIELICS